MKSLSRITAAVVGVLFLSTGLAIAQDLSVGNYVLTDKKRVSRVVYEYKYKAELANSGPEAKNVTASVTSQSQYVIVTDSHVFFDDVPAGATVTSADTFSIQVDRRYPFDQSCLQWEIHVRQQLGSYDPPPNNILQIVENLPENASQAEIEGKLDDILYAVGTRTRRDMDIVRESFMQLRKQPNIVQALTNKYNALPAEAFSKRRLTVAVMGELQRVDARSFLSTVAWNALPPAQNYPDGPSPREMEETLQVKAVQGIGFIRNNDGTLNNEAVNETINVMVQHPSKSVRISAIDIYMWNHDDSEQAADTLRGILQPEFHKYIERPRFSYGENRETFEKRLQDWRNKWTP